MGVKTCSHKWRYETFSVLGKVRTRRQCTVCGHMQHPGIECTDCGESLWEREGHACPQSRLDTHAELSLSAIDSGCTEAALVTMHAWLTDLTNIALGRDRT